MFNSMRAALSSAAFLFISTGALAGAVQDNSQLDGAAHYAVRATPGGQAVACEMRGIRETNCLDVHMINKVPSLANVVQVNVGLVAAGATWIEEREATYELCALDAVKTTHCQTVGFPRLLGGVARLEKKTLKNGDSVIAYSFDPNAKLNKRQMKTLADAFRQYLQVSIQRMKTELDTVGVPTTVRPLIDTSPRTTKVIVAAGDCPPVDAESTPANPDGSVRPATDCGGGSGGGGDGGDGGSGGGGGGDVGSGGGDGGGSVGFDPNCGDRCEAGYMAGSRACNDIPNRVRAEACWAFWATVLADCMAEC